MHHTREEWLKAISENPKENSIKLVYADWLDENDEQDNAIAIRLEVLQLMNMVEPGLRRYVCNSCMSVFDIGCCSDTICKHCNSSDIRKYEQ